MSLPLAFPFPPRSAGKRAGSGTKGGGSGACGAQDSALTACAELRTRPDRGDCGAGPAPVPGPNTAFQNERRIPALHVGHPPRSPADPRTDAVGGAVAPPAAGRASASGDTNHSPTLSSVLRQRRNAHYRLVPLWLAVFPETTPLNQATSLESRNALTDCAFAV